ncbi:hypothetical protein J6590_041785 [Homalodisca vitripennis]|nr:hypothetical protein J6590_041785 [Homalodisca vitripennis]
MDLVPIPPVIVLLPEVRLEGWMVIFRLQHLFLCTTRSMRQGRLIHGRGSDREIQLSSKHDTKGEMLRRAECLDGDNLLPSLYTPFESPNLALVLWLYSNADVVAFDATEKAVKGWTKTLISKKKHQIALDDSMGPALGYGRGGATNN